MLKRVDARLTEVEVDGEIAVYHPKTDRVVLLNSSASAIWRRLPVRGVQDLVDHLVDVFNVNVDEARVGAETGIALLANERLLADADDHVGYPADDLPDQRA
ncbi:PqqD family protein [Aquipuribacter nitratireducens]|uniref:PqqD family protein n=1 Tax=Aquipuribacter nitratireducens TaxID=650104 RepID=A0ABW0GQF6_9MICO